MMISIIYVLLHSLSHGYTISIWLYVFLLNDIICYLKFYEFDQLSFYALLAFCVLSKFDPLSGLIEVDGWGALHDKFLSSASNETKLMNRTCGYAPDNSFHVIRPATDGGYPWTGMVFGLPILATNAWCTDQVSHYHCDVMVDKLR